MTTIIQAQPTGKAPAQVRLRQATLEDYEQIAALERRNGLDGRTQQEWQHLWVNNPALPNGWPVGWALEEGGGRVVGFIGNIPTEYELNGQRLLAASGHSWVVDREHRGSSILLLKQFLHQKQVDLFLNTSANAQAADAFLAFKASQIPVGKWNECCYWVTNYHGFVCSWTKMKSWWLARLGSYPVLLATSACAKMMSIRGLWRENCADVQVCQTFDQRFDAFWEELRSSKTGLLSLRTRAALDWHFKQALARKEVLILTAESGSHLQAYSVFVRQDNHRIGLRRMRLVDFQCVRGTAALFLFAMLCHALRDCVNNRVHTLEIIGVTPDNSFAIERLSPRHRRLPSWLYLYKANRPALERMLQDPHLWNPTAYDGDASL